jgi:biotin operon repressor
VQKVDQKLLLRMQQLKKLTDEDGRPLSNEAIAKRLGVASRTIRAYLNGHMDHVQFSGD